MSATFEALKLLATLEAAGSLPDGASPVEDALSEAAGEELATKADVERLRTELRQRLLALENDTRAEIDALRRRVAAVKTEQLVMKWVLGFNFAMIGALLFLLATH